MYTLRTEQKQKGRKGGKRKEVGGQGEKAGLVSVCQWGQARGRRGPQVRLREAVPSTTTGWHRRPRLALDRRSRWAGPGQAWRADLGCSQPSSLQAKGGGQSGHMFWPLGICFCQLTPRFSITHSVGILFLLRDQSLLPEVEPVWCVSLWGAVCSGSRARILEEKRKGIPRVRAGRANENTGAEEGRRFACITWLSWDHPEAPARASPRAGVGREKHDH